MHKRTIGGLLLKSVFLLFVADQLQETNMWPNQGDFWFHFFAELIH